MTPVERLKNTRFQPVTGYPDLELDTKSGYYYVRKRMAGKGELFKSTRSKKRGLAATRAQELIDEFRGRKAGLRNTRIKIAKLCDLAYAQCLKDSKAFDEDGRVLRRPHTIEHDRTWLLDIKRDDGREYPAKLKELLGDVYADEIDELFWKTWCKREGRALGRKLGDVGKYLSLVLSHAFEQKYIARKPRIRNPDKHKRKAVVYSDEQVLAFYSCAEPMLQDLIVVGSENPLRPHENAEIRWEWVTLTGGEVEYDLPEAFVKKGARRLRLTPNAAAVIIRRAAERRRLPVAKRSPFVFPAPKDPSKPVSRKTVNRMWHRMKAKAGIPQDTKVQFHWFRHNVFRRLTKIHGLTPAEAAQAGGTSAATIEKHYALEEDTVKLRVASAISLPFFGTPRKEEEE